MPSTLFEKIWTHTLSDTPVDQPALFYIDLHLVHEVTSPQAFEGLRVAKSARAAPDLTDGDGDHKRAHYRPDGCPMPIPSARNR